MSATATENRRRALIEARKRKPKAAPKDPRPARLQSKIRIKDRLKKVAKGKTFESVDWSDVDQRHHRVKAIKKISKELFASCNLDSPQKRLLAERAAFIVALVRNEETLALQGEEFNQAKYVSLVTKLQSMLTVLGLDPTAKNEVGLSGYVQNKSKK